MYVDGLWVKQSGHSKPEHLQPLLAEIMARTGLPIVLDGIYKWVAFLPSRMDGRVAVPNRYFGVFQDGEIKMRGIETRRHDTPRFVSETQMEILQCLAKAPDASRLVERLPEIHTLIRRRLSDLRHGRVPLDKLIVRLTVSRTLDQFRTPSPTAVALGQLETVGKFLQPGQHVRLIYTRGSTRARAWDLPQPIDPRTVDVARYTRLLLRATRAILDPTEPAPADPYQLPLW